MATTVAELIEKSEQTSAKAADSYEELVSLLDAGSEIDEKWALKSLREAGRSFQELSAELNRRKQIATLREQIAGAEEIRRQRVNLERELAEKKQELEDHKKRFAGEEARIDGEISRCVSRLFDIDQARRELRALAPPLSEQAELQRELRAVVKSVARLESMTAKFSDPRKRQAEVQRLDDAIAATCAEIEKRRQREGDAFIFPVHRLTALERERDELQRYSSYDTFFEQLENARARAEELRGQIAALAAA